jgi:hypothetical protein
VQEAEWLAWSRPIAFAAAETALPQDAAVRRRGGTPSRGRRAQPTPIIQCERPPSAGVAEWRNPRRLHCTEAIGYRTGSDGLKAAPRWGGQVLDAWVKEAVGFNIMDKKVPRDAHAAPAQRLSR